LKPSLSRKLGGLAGRFEEVAGLLADPEVHTDPDRFRSLGQEYAQLEPIIECYQNYQRAGSQMTSAKAMLQEEPDAELRALAAEELEDVRARRDALAAELQRLLLPTDPNDTHNVFLEIRAGTGGAEAALFAGDLYRMYLRYAETQGWGVETLAESPGEHGGYKEVVVRIAGAGVYSRLKFESGAHRVQRVPETESQRRIHTSACMVAVLPEPEAIEAMEVNPADLRVDTYRAAGAGGQHVNKTDSAVRLTHLPSGIVVECQDERSQHKNRARALSLLQARLLEAERTRQRDERAETRRLLVGSGDRSERIRTYNFPQGRVTDHRVNLTLYKLNDLLAGELDLILAPLIQEHQADLLASLAD